ncbi:MAG: DUF5916 domain-containing protein [Ginsengibacter sp.]
MSKLFLLFIGFGCIAYPTYSQTKSISSVKTNQVPRIDGNPDDAVWKSIPYVSEFETSTPVFGKPADETHVKICYSNSAVYVLAYMHDDPKNIRKQLTRRDEVTGSDVDFFSIGIDTYHDKQNAFLFKVSAAGVQEDAKISSTEDVTWNAVWESKVSLKKNGWIVEMKIPFSAIRFSKSKWQTWGIQFTRFRRAENETSTWSPDDPDIDGTINKWGELTGLRNIMPPIRLSFLPYVSGGINISPVGNTTQTEFLKSGGMDVKYGINESFTVDATLIPDFAQVQSDNIVLNLSPFDVKFEDFRPFFTEGTELFNKAGIFYSRRIGAAPSGAYGVLAKSASNPDYEIIKNPGITRLINGTKFSGRTKGNLGIGIFNAVTSSMNAEIFDKSTDSTMRIQTEPLTNYNIIVLDQALKNRSSVTFTNTNVLRNGNSRNANVSAVDVSLFDKRNRHYFFVDGIYSTIWGKQGNYDGYKADIRYQKVSGKFQYSLIAGAMSDTYDPNDLGFLYNNNQFTYTGNISYVIYKPTKHFLNQRYTLGATDQYLYNPFLWQNFVINSTAFLLMKDFSNVLVTFQVSPMWSNDYFELRTPGSVLKRPAQYFLNVTGSTDSRKKLFLDYSAESGITSLPDPPYYGFTLGATYKFNERFQMNAEGHLEKDEANYGYAYRDMALVPEPVLGQRTVKTDYSILGADYAINPLMNINVRLRHYWSNVIYHHFYDVKEDGYWTERSFSPGHDFNFNTFNIDMFYTWDFLPGSRITLSWKNALGADVYLDENEYRTYFKNFNQVLQSPHSNEVSVKVVYYLDYLQLKRHKAI